jgi:hypothetical protein
METLEQLLQDVKNGNESALKAYAILKKTEDSIKTMIDEVKEQALQEAAQHSEKTFSDHGYIFEKRNGSARYSFKHIEEWNNLKEEIKQLETRSKQAYSSYQKGMLSATTDGEEIELPVVTFTSDVLIVK